MRRHGPRPFLYAASMHGLWPARGLTAGLVIALVATVLTGAVWQSPPLHAEDAAEPASPVAPTQRVHLIDFEGEIGPILQAFVRRHVAEAQADGATTIVLRIESPGGRVKDSGDISDLLMGLPKEIHTIAWIPRYAYSGASMVALACREIVMGPSARTGDCQPILMGPQGIVKAGEKIESPLRATFRSFAEAHGWPEALCEAFVSEDVEVLEVRGREDGARFFVRRKHWDVDPATTVRGTGRSRESLVAGPVVVPKGELLTITTQQAMDMGFILPGGLGTPPPTSEAQLETRMRERGLIAPGTTWTIHEPSFAEQAIAFLHGLSGILAAIVAVSATLSLMRGSLGVAGFVGLGAAALLLLIQVSADQEAGFGLFLVLLGLVLIALEIFIIPGFGIPGILGMVAFGAGFFFMSVGGSPGDLGETIAPSELKDFALQFVFGILAMLGAFFLLSRWVPTVGPARRMVLAAPEAGAVPPPARPVSGTGPQIGDRMIATSDLRPAGSARLGEQLFDVVADGPYVEEGTALIVHTIEGPRIIVRVEDASR